MTWHEVDVSGWHADRIWAVDQNDGYITEWHCEPPAFGTPVKVTREDWTENPAGRRQPDFTVTLTMPGGREVTADPGYETIPVRRIYAWKPGDTP